MTCPVALYTATNSAGDVHFHLINPETNNRIKMVTTDPDTGPVSRSALVKGFEVQKGEYILVTNEEIQSVKLESTKTIDIERFVPAADIDRTYWDHPYFLAPDGAMALEAFAVIREAMQRSGRIALGRVVLSTRERIVALEPKGRGMMAYSLRTRDEVRSGHDIFDKIGDSEPDPSMISIAEKIIEQKEGPFDPDQFIDRYEQALKALIEAKRQGHTPDDVEEPKDTNVIDLLAALKASLGKTPSAPKRSEPKKAASAKKKTTPARRKSA